jgi:DNA-binding MarR family transcriptional regulator
MPDVIRHAIRQPRPFPSIEDEVFVGIQLAAHRLLAPWARTLAAEADLSPVQYNVLRILRGAGDRGLTCGEIGERMISRDPDITRLTDRMATRGLVRRDRDADDRRVVRTRITPAGLEHLRRLDTVIAERRATLFRNLSPSELRTLRATLEKVIAGAEPVL